MNISKWAQGAVGLSVAAALLAACSSNGTGAGLTPSGGNGSVSPAIRGNLNYSLSHAGMRAAHPATGKSWMAAAAKNTKIAYDTDAANYTMNAYSYLGGTQLGQITGLSQPQGMCSVPARPQVGNVWLANTTASQMLEYAPGGTSPIATINVPNQYTVSCGVDPTTGNLAVGNIISTSGGAGSVYVYTSPSSSPTTYSVPNMGRVYFMGYDPSGNLFVDGQNSSSIFTFAELPKGGSAFQTLSVSGLSVTFPGTVAWDGQKVGHLVVCDQLGICYQLTESGSTLSVSGSFTLQGAGDVVQGTPTKSKFLAPDASLNQFNWYNYPAGTLYKSIPGQTYGQPIGSALGLTKI